MKNKFTYLLLLLLALTSACIKKPKFVTVAAPLGIFNGQLTLLRRDKTKYDTLTSNIQLTLSTSIGYVVQCDTTIQALSYGSFSYTATDFTFVDDDTSSPTKLHLNGDLPYFWDGTNLQLEGVSPNDSLVYTYNLKLTTAP